MIQQFNFSRTPDLLFGKDAAKKLPEYISQFGNYFLLITGSNSFAKSVYGQEILKLINSKGLAYNSIEVGSEPTADFINGVCKFYKHNKYAVVVTIGGGSVIDAGKAIAAMITVGDSIENYLEGSQNFKQHPGTKIPLIAVPTTAGTGSEATKNAVISMIGEHGYKRSLRHNNFVPDIAIVDPILHLTCPENISAASGLDAFTQLLESYFSTQSSILTDNFAFEGLKLVANSLEKVVADGNNIEARTEMALAAYLSGICLANAGLGAVHGFASSVGGYFDIPHGIICGTLLGSTNRKNIEKLLIDKTNNEMIEKYARIGKLFCKEINKSDEFYIHEFADAVDRLIEKLKMPKLSTYGVSTEDINRIVAITSCKNNPVPLTKEDLSEILLKRI